MLFLGAFSAVEELSEHERMSAFLLDSVAATQTNSTTFLDDDSQAHDEERGSYCSIVAELRHLELDLVEVTASCQENIDEIHFWRFAPWERALGFSQVADPAVSLVARWAHSDVARETHSHSFKTAQENS